jgi:Domain of unknown function (DUF4169)
MGDVVNLRRARKHKARKTAEAAASVNRSLHGLSKPERKAAKARAAKDKRDLDVRLLDPETPD